MSTFIGGPRPRTPHDAVLDAYREVPKEIARRERELADLRADETRFRGVHLLLLHVAAGATCERLAQDTDETPEEVTRLLTAGREGLRVRHGWSYYGPQHLTCLSSTLSERLDELGVTAPDKPHTLHPIVLPPRRDTTEWWWRWTKILLDAYIEATGERDDYGLATVAAAEMSLQAKCARCKRTLWQWEHTHGVGMPEVPAHLRYP
ncbi:hypothetical protein OG948_60595 (plasmid) [Embleya sp. NBC_00888]|uniref:hypothetical protein n=1 Tax=Embleya sp. NBC_00888 TaxID=2975960 RepID=UPI002F9183C8|nr:hypothetical protein OG948_60595 [Embleya sp. NBC_00888]